ncbi:hypothetical protein [Streptomyces sp. NPDC058297]|uniref:hypothetical protein n=1 Tax=Streptomyces sp. NPDC058297 TaxID=3346433 RepID=UPI0036E074F9
MRRFRQDRIFDEARHCACRKLYSRCSGGMLAFVEDSAEAVFSTYVEVGALCAGERFGDGTQGCCLMHRLVGSVCVVVQFELAERVA